MQVKWQNSPNIAQVGDAANKTGEGWGEKTKQVLSLLVRGDNIALR